MALVARWRCNEDPAIHGTTLVDSSGNGYDMILYTNDGSTNKSVIGKQNKAIELDGSNDYARINTQIISAPTQLTICGWFRKESGGGTYECVLHSASNSNIGTSSYWFGVDNGDKLCATIGANSGAPGGWAAGLTTTTAVYGTWYHLMAVWDGSVVRVYINNVFDKQYNQASYNSINYPTRIGASADGTTYQFRGGVEDVRIYNHALTEAERTEVFEGFKPGPLPLFRRIV